MILPRVSAAIDLVERVRHIKDVSFARLEIVFEHIDLVSSLGKYAQKRLHGEAIYLFHPN
jgi:hypothetical protein